MGYAVMSTDQLWELYSQDRSNRDLVEELTRRYVPMVRAIVNRFGLAANVVEDALQAAFIGLLEALQHFEPARGYKFTTFGQRRVWGAVVDYIRMQPWTQLRLSRGQQKLILKIHDIEEAFAAAYHRSPVSDRELAEFSGLPLTSLKEGRWLEQQSGDQIRLDAPVHNPGKTDNGISTYADMVELFDGACDYDRVDASDEHGLLYAFIKLLPDQYRLILYYRYYQELTNKRIAEIVGLSEARISQILDRAIHKLREAFKMPHHLKRFIAAFVNESETDDSTPEPRPRILQIVQEQRPREEGTEEVSKGSASTKDPSHGRGFALVLAVGIYVWKKAPERLSFEGIKAAIGSDCSTASINAALVKLKEDGILVGTDKRGIYHRGKVHHLLFLGKDPEAVVPSLLPDFIAQPKTIYNIADLAEQVITAPPAVDGDKKTHAAAPEPSATTPTNGKAHVASSFDYAPIALRAHAEGLRAQAAEFIRQATVLEETARMKELFAEAKAIMESTQSKPHEEVV